MKQHPRNQVRHPFRGLGARLMLLYMLLLMIPILGLGISGHLYIQRALMQSVLEKRLDEVAVRATAIDALIGQMHDDIRYIEQRLVLDSDAAINVELAQLAQTHLSYHHLAWLGLNGQVLSGSMPEALYEWVSSESFEELETLAPDTIRFHSLHTDEPGSEPQLLAAVRLQGGVLLLDLYTAYLLQNTEPTEAEGTWALLLPPNTLLTLADELALTELGIEQMENRSGVIFLDEQVNLYHRTGPGDNWALIYSLPRQAILPNLAAYYAVVFLIVLGGLVSVSGLALRSISRMVEPVYQLEGMVDQLRQGTARPTLPSPLPGDEFGKLMKAFDRMAAELDQKRRAERSLIEQLIRAQEEERKRIAYDLHDGLIQELVAARFYLGQARAGCQADEQPSSVGDHLQTGYDLLTHAIADGRRIIQGLHPTVLEDLGLEAALRELVQSMAEAASWTVHLDIATLQRPPDRATRVTLYRITQEALNNVFKHANANEVWVGLNEEATALHLSIRDDGCGFDPAPILKNGGQCWGIRTMRERATMLRGTCTITSQPGQGARVAVTIPSDKRGNVKR